MKTMITFILICITTIAMSQNTPEQSKMLISNEKTVALQEVLQNLSKKLEPLQQEGVLITQAEMKMLKAKLAETMVKLENSPQFEEVAHITRKVGDKIKISYTVSQNNLDAEESLTLEDVNFEAIGDTLMEVITELQDSPQLKELAAKMEELEEKYKTKETKN